MAYPRHLRLKARELRIEKQLTLDELVERLALPKSTVYYWIKDLPLGRPRRASAGQRKGNGAMQLKGRSWRSHYGVLTMYVCDTMLRARLEGWIDRIKENWGVDSPLATGRGAVW